MVIVNPDWIRRRRAFREASRQFDAYWYQQQLERSGTVALATYTHFHEEGWRLELNPTRWFNTTYYLASNPDVSAKKVDPFLHFVVRGSSEGRRPNSDANCQGCCEHDSLAFKLFDAEYYLTANPDVGAVSADPFGHYMAVGWREGRRPNAWLDLSRFDAHYSAWFDESGSPIANLVWLVTGTRECPACSAVKHSYAKEINHEALEWFGA